MAKKCDQPCKGCPWRRENQTPAAVAASPMAGGGVRWFEVSNLRRHWENIRTVGAMLPCHMTDANAPLYGGKPTKGGHEHICVGVAILAKREVHTLMEQGSDFANYARLPGKRFTAAALAAWAARLFYDGAQFNMLGRSFRMPKIGQSQDDRNVCLPWADSISGKDRIVS